MATYFLDQIFTNENSLALGEYENCSFKNCDFSNSNLSEYKFIECDFTSCNLSLSKLNQTLLQKVTFSNCKLLGLNFNDCNEFSLSFTFTDCQLNHASFFKLKIKK
ncbi:MAG: pentapeptide repeat-containing protein, partial [Moheibacter sp.]